MSPEQATRRQARRAPDLYAVGVILYQLTTGMLPFDGANSLAILTKHVTELAAAAHAPPEAAISAGHGVAHPARALEGAGGAPQSAEEFRGEILKIRDLLRRRREDAEESAKKAATQHKEQRSQAIYK